MVWLKCFGRLGYFPALETVPGAVVDHVRRDLGLAEEIAAVHAAARTTERHRDLVRRRFGVVLDGLPVASSAKTTISCSRGVPG